MTALDSTHICSWDLSHKTKVVEACLVKSPLVWHHLNQSSLLYLSHPSHQLLQELSSSFHFFCWESLIPPQKRHDCWKTISLSLNCYWEKTLFLGTKKALSVCSWKGFLSGSRFSRSNTCACRIVFSWHTPVLNQFQDTCSLSFYLC